MQRTKGPIPRATSIRNFTTTSLLKIFCRMAVLSSTLCQMTHHLDPRRPQISRCRNAREIGGTYYLDGVPVAVLRRVVAPRRQKPWAATSQRFLAVRLCFRRYGAFAGPDRSGLVVCRRPLRASTLERRAGAMPLTRRCDEGPVCQLCSTWHAPMLDRECSTEKFLESHGILPTRVPCRSECRAWL